VKICAYIPIRLPFPAEDLDWLVDGSIKQIVKLRDVQLSPEYDHLVRISRVGKREMKSIESQFREFSIREIAVLKFSTEIPDDGRDWSCVASDGSRVGSQNVLQAVMATEIAFLAHKVVFAANIARPGSLHCMQGLVAFDGHYYERVPGLTNSLEMMFTFGKQPKWPGVEMLKIQNVWDWISGIDDFHDGFGTTPIGKALAAYSYFFTHEFGHESPLDNLYAIVALESLYDSNGSHRYLSERIALFLGAHPKGKNVVKDLYHERSLLIHGNTKMPFQFCVYDAMPQVTNFRSRESSFWDTSLPILIATLQRMAKEDIYSIEFETRLINKRPN
jgi:hypothetical protein